jgi:hypothetical protein
MRFGRSESGGVPFKARPVPNSKEATGQPSIFTRVTIGRLEDPLIGLQRASETDVEAVVIALRSFGGLYSPMFIGFQVVAIPKLRMSLRIDTKN